jgi:N-acetylglucosaminyldiphosphoundecaprenol N-acetyl-beta-D-mannosaminyltransferase
VNNELEYYEILKTNINVTNMKDTLRYIEDNLDKLSGDYICVSNVHTTVMSYENESYRQIQNNAAMALPDGAPLSGYCRLRGIKYARRVTGPDLMLEMFKISANKGYRHFFYGSRPETLDDMKKNILEKYPNMTIVGMYSPPFRELTKEEDDEIVDIINNANPDFIWVGLGAPKQEIWMSRHKGKFKGVMIGVGAGFDYFAGYIKRAPKIMQVLYLEWLYRLMQDPKRLWKRYVTTNVRFVQYIIKEIRSEHVKEHVRKHAK